GGHVYWLEGRPQEQRRYVVVRADADGQPTDITPPPYNARTRVHEYGGGSWTGRNGTGSLARNSMFRRSETCAYEWFRNSLPFASLQKSSGEILVSRERSSVDVRLQSAPCGVPTRKGRRQTRNDPVQQLDHARFYRRGRTKRGGVPASRHRGCVREGDRVRARVWPFLKLET